MQHSVSASLFIFFDNHFTIIDLCQHTNIASISFSSFSRVFWNYPNRTVYLHDGDLLFWRRRRFTNNNGQFGGDNVFKQTQGNKKTNKQLNNNNKSINGNTSDHSINLLFFVLFIYLDLLCYCGWAYCWCRWNKINSRYPCQYDGHRFKYGQSSSC